MRGQGRPWGVPTTGVAAPLLLGSDPRIRQSGGLGEMRLAREPRNAEDAAVTPDLPPRDEIAAFHLMDEARLVGGLIERAIYTAEERRRIAEVAGRLVRSARASRDKHGGI